MSIQAAALFRGQTDIHIKTLYSKKNEDGMYDGAKIFSSPEDLYTYIKNGGEAYEFSTPDTLWSKVFWDIDIAVDKVSEADRDLLERRVDNMVSFLAKSALDLCNSNSCLYRKTGRDIEKVELCPATVREAVKEITDNAVVTKSNNPDKISYHVIFPNFVAQPIDWHVLTPALRNQLQEAATKSNVSKHRLHIINAIDFVVWKKLITLRCPLSRKTNQDTSYHTVIRGNPEDALLTWIPDNPDNPYFVVIMTPDDQTSDPFQTAIDNPENILETKNNEEVNTEVNKILFDLLGDQLTQYYDAYEDEESYLLKLDYSMRGCPFCKKNQHANNHYLIKTGRRIIIQKYGNPANCKKVMLRLKLDDNKYLKIARVFYNFNDIKKYQEDHFIIWMGSGWSFERANYSITSYILKNHKKAENDEIRALLQDYNKRKLVEKNLVDLIGADPPVQVDAVPHIMYFTNGCYDLLNDVFYTGTSAKQYIGFLTTGYAFDPDWASNQKITNAIADLYGVMDQIQPPHAHNMDNKELYEIILSSCLYGGHKEYVTFFLGGTMGGKSTSKKMVNAALGNMMVETNSSILTEVLDAKRPNPFLASINHKRVVFASELPNMADAKFKIRSVNIKKFTEDKVISRLCYSNLTEQKNNATWVFDSNFEPCFDTVDGALVRRCLMVNFNSAFVDEKSKMLVGSRKDVFELRGNLSALMATREYKIAAFIILKDLFRKHFLNADNEIVLPFRTTPEKFKDFTLIRKLPEFIIGSSTETINDIHSKYSDIYTEIGNSLYCEENELKNYLFRHFPAKTFGNDIQDLMNQNSVINTNGDTFVKFIIKKHLLAQEVKL